MRLSIAKLKYFLKFSTSEYMMQAVPWGTMVMYTTEGKIRIEARVKVMRQERHIKQYYKYLKELGIYNEMKMSRSQLIRIMKFCPAKISKAYSGDYN